MAENNNESNNAEIYEYNAPWLIYAMNWSNITPFRIAMGSFLEEYTNCVDIVQLHQESGTFKKIGSFDHPYPATKIMWSPANTGKELIATTGDYLRLWEVTDSGVKLKDFLNNNKNSEFCAPLTSFDWSETDPSLIGTSSIDTTCTIWNIHTQQAITQLIAHDKEVYDIAFGKDSNTFASVGAEGQVRMFDLRSLEQSTIIYENNDNTPLLRIAWNKLDDHYLATISMDSPKVVILDRRVPSLPAAEIQGQFSASINSFAWAPHSSCHICTAGDDKQALIWDLSKLPQPIERPMLAYNAESEINQLQWSSLQPNWISIAFSSKIQILRV